MGRDVGVENIYADKNIHKLTFRASLFIIAKNWKQHKCLLIE